MTDILRQETVVQSESIVPVVLRDEDLHTLVRSTRKWVRWNVSLNLLVIFGLTMYAAITFGNQNQIYKKAMKNQVMSEQSAEDLAQKTATQTVEAVAERADAAVATQKAKDAATTTESLTQLKQLTDQAKNIKATPKHPPKR